MINQLYVLVSWVFGLFIGSVVGYTVSLEVGMPAALAAIVATSLGWRVGEIYRRTARRDMEQPRGS